MDPLNPFAALDDAASAACEAAFGIRARIVPCAAPGSYGEDRPDLDRAPVDVVGILSSAPGLQPAAGQGTDRFGGPTQVSGQTVVLSLSAAAVRSLGWEIQPGDRVVLPDVTAPYPTRFRVSRLVPTDMGDLELVLNEANEG